jgi:hypothetical protein
MTYENLEIKDKKVLSKVLLPANSIILEFKGDILLKQNILNFNDVLQISLTQFLSLSGEMDDLVRHNCNPTCGLRIIGTRALLVSLYDIKPGMEITFDYSTSSNLTKEEWEMECFCQSEMCRQKISGFQYLSDDLKKSYISKKIVPLYLIK